MRILIVASWYPGTKAPARGSFIREQALALARHGHEVHIAYFDKDSQNLPFRINTTYTEELVEHAIVLPFPLHRIIGFYFPSLAARALRKICAKIRPDIVHAHAARPAGVIASIAIRDLRVPLVLTEHKSNLQKYWKTGHGKRQIESAYLCCDRLYAVSKAFKKDLESTFPKTSALWKLNYNGIDTKLFRIRKSRLKPFDQPEIKLLFLGGMEKRKGLSTLLEAFKSLPNTYSLTIVGRGASTETVEDLAPHGMPSRITVRGPASRAEIIDLLNDHDLLVVPSWQETFGLVCAEALACGTPVVATICGGPEEIITKMNGRLFNPGDHEALSNILRTFPMENDFSSEAAHEYISKYFSMDAVVTRLDTDYKSLLAESRPESLNNN